MPRRHRPIAPAGALLLLCCLHASPALAVGAQSPTLRSAPSLGQLIADLRDGETPERRLAARELRATVAADLRASLRKGDELDRADAQGRLQDHDERTAPACLEVLELPEATVPCLRILGMLETDAARGPVQALADGAESGRVRRVARWALDRIGTGP